ncbi:hypothetical protein ACS0TY_033574 [Phlomoides rotata]
MAVLNCNSIIKPQVVASSNDSSSPSPSPSHNPQLKLNKQQPGKQIYRKLKKKKQQQPTVFEIERAIGAGVEGEEEKAGLLDNILRNTVGKNEGDVEKKLRETGEWLISRTENTSRSAGKQILVIMFLWVIPLWMCAFVVASGILPLPFHSPFLDSLLNS